MPTQIRPLLWKLRHAPVHIIGTFHLGPPDGYSLGPDFAAAFTAATSLVCEVGPADKNFDQALLQRHSSSLESDIGPRLYSRLRNDPRYQPLLETIQPALVVTILVSQLYMDAGLIATTSVDATLEQEAKASGKQCSGFETMTEQLLALCSIDHAAVCRAFEFLLIQPELMLKVRDLIINSFATGNADGMQTARELTVQWSPSFAEIMFHDREGRWIPRIQSIVSGGQPTMIAVGTVHLVGNDGLLARLAAQGIVADRVNP